MKRKTIATALLLVLVLSSFTTTAYALDNCLKDSFTLLESVEYSDGSYGGCLLPPNDVGSCGYTAMSMLLMYYDTFWHKDFVPDNLEWMPGKYDVTNDVLLSTFSEFDEYNAWSTFSKSLAEEQYIEGFKDFALANSNDYLQSHLFDIGWNEYKNTVYLIDAIKYVVLPYMAEFVLESYLYDEVGFSKDAITIHKESGTIEELRPQISSQISNGNPVLFFGATFEGLGLFKDGLISDDKSGHVMLAYKTDDNGEIYLNYGWNDTDSELKLSETEYIYHTSIVWLEIGNLSHECDDNFVDSVDSETKYCACQIYGSTHPAHGNNHLFVDRTDENHHWKGCNCGAKIDVQEHSFYYTSAFTSHTLKCYECDYFVNSAHTFEIVGNVSETYHEVECFCGYIKNEKHSKGYIVGDHDAYCDCGQYIGIEHKRGYCEYNSLANHNIYCTCGEFLGREVHTTITKMGKTYCKGCLHVFDSDSIHPVNGSKDKPEAITE